MRQLTTSEIEKIKLLTEKSVELCIIEPTETGLKKSIMDATGTVRTYLKSKSIHDFTLQKQGQENKILINSTLISSYGIIPSTASLYRPNTKKGDPRIWFKGLGNYAKANDILGIIAYEDELFVINITQLEFSILLNDINPNPLKDLINEINYYSNEVSTELLLEFNLQMQLLVDGE